MLHHELSPKLKLLGNEPNNVHQANTFSMITQKSKKKEIEKIIYAP